MEGLFGDRVTDVRFEKRAVRVERFGKPEEFRDFFKARYGPTVAVYRRIEGDLEKVAELDLALAELAGRHDVGTSGLVMEWEYLVATARRR